MKKRYFEKTNAETSLLGFGCMRFPVLEDGSIDEELTFKMLDKAYAEGVQLLLLLYVPVGYYA